MSLEAIAEDGALRGPVESGARRLAAGSVRDPATGCLIWQKAVNGKGYAVLWFAGRLHLGHRVAFLLAHGRWPAPGMVLDHVVCSRPACVNAGHVAERTNGQNIMRAIPRGDAATEARRSKWRRSQQVSRRRRAES